MLAVSHLFKKPLHNNCHRVKGAKIENSHKATYVKLICFLLLGGAVVVIDAV